MQKIILTVGIPGSGKSTWAKQEVLKDPLNWVRINNDDIRMMINQSVFSNSIEKIVNKTRLFLVSEALKHGKNIIIDNLNITKSHFEDIEKIVSKIKGEFEISEKIFYVSLQEAMERDSKRIGSANVGEKVIKIWWSKSGKESLEKREPKIKIVKNYTIKNNNVIKQDETLPKAIIVDIDGTVADISNRSPHNYTLCKFDKPIKHVIDIVKMFYDKGAHVIFVSGRQDSCLEDTKEWIIKHNIVPDFDIYLRSEKDSREDIIVKNEIYETYIKGKYNILAIFEDRLKVCQFWHDNGFPLFRVGDPSADF